MNQEVLELLKNYSGNVIGALQTENSVIEPLYDKVVNWRSCLLNIYSGIGAIGVMADNSPDWIAIDLAAALVGIPLVPLPAFFTNDQLLYLMQEAGVSILITDQLDRSYSLGMRFTGCTPAFGLSVVSNDNQPIALPLGIQKVTFTSGTTGQPKGVCLGISQQLHVALALAESIAELDIKIHLCLLPLSVLLENIAGVYAPMLAGANIACPSLVETGLVGASQFDAERCLHVIERYSAQSIILLPQMLFAILQACQIADPRVATLKFIAVGGGQVPHALLMMAKTVGLPVFEGYGLTECGSVVCLNTPQASRVGSVGRPLPGLDLKVDDTQEIWVKGRAFEGYLTDLKNGLGNTLLNAEWLPTGDLGEIDGDGFVFIRGRKKNLIITSFGRNVSPEWPEGLLLASGAFLQAVVYGEGRTSLGVVLVPRPTCSQEVIKKALAQVNAQLPDYAQINYFLVAIEPFSFSNQLTTSNGRILRDAIWECYGQALFTEYRSND